MKVSAAAKGAAKITQRSISWIVPLPPGQRLLHADDRAYRGQCFFVGPDDCTIGEPNWRPEVGKLRNSGSGIEGFWGLGDVLGEA